MDLATILVDSVFVMWIMAVIAGAIRAVPRPLRLKPLSPEAQQRYLLAWDVISTRFVHAPHEAVQRADSLVIKLLDDRGHPIEDARLPRDMQRARQKGIASRDQPGTDHLRQAMLHYRAVFDRMVGGRGFLEARYGGRELA